MKASAAIYFGVPASERRRIAKALRKEREKRDDALATVTRLRDRKTELGDVLARDIAGAQRVPVGLLACHLCGRPTPQCACLDADGKPLDWALS